MSLGTKQFHSRGGFVVSLKIIYTVIDYTCQNNEIVHRSRTIKIESLVVNRSSKQIASSDSQKFINNEAVTKIDHVARGCDQQRITSFISPSVTASTFQRMTEKSIPLSDLFFRVPGKHTMTPLTWRLQNEFVCHIDC